MISSSENFLILCFLHILLIKNIYGQMNDYTTPVPILKQINRHNEDGSYSYGYEGADGSFKIETKYPNGEVYGKYGYVDDSGKQREVEYGASRRGFEPQGNDINVPPPTLRNDNPNLAPLGPNEEDDGQYREDPSIYFKDQKYNRPIAPSNFRLNSVDPSPQKPSYHAPLPPAPVHNYNPAPVHNYNPAPYYQPRAAPAHPYQQPYYPPPKSFNNVNVPVHHHPALKKIDIWSGSYSIDYTGR